jgi:enoyl-CoA hydratase/carnithine racemase
VPETIKVEDVAPGVAAVTFNRPEVANALSTRMGEELLATWQGFAARADLRCVILRGEGKHFQAGADLKERNGMTDEAWAAQHKLFEDMIRAQIACPAIVIAAVQGAAMGGGAEMALASDFIYAAEGARFGLPEVTLGIMPGLGGTQNLLRAAGSRRAIELLVTGKHFTAQDALDWGVVNAVVPADGLLEAVMEVARKIGGNAPLSVRGLKRVVQKGADMDRPAAMDFEVEEYNKLFVTADRREGVAAFNEKRAPTFQGK